MIVQIYYSVEYAADLNKKKNFSMWLSKYKDAQRYAAIYPDDDIMDQVYCI
jgi:hypothetical protein